MTNLKNYLIAILALLAVSVSALAWKQYRELVVLRAAAVSGAERADLQKRLWAAQKRAGPPANQVTGVRPPNLAATPTDSGGPRPGRAELGRMVTGMASMMDRPETARLMGLQQKAQVDSRYAALFKKLGLAPDKLAQLKSLLADKLAAPMDVMAAAGQQGVDPVRNPQEFRQLVQDAQAQVDDRIKGLLDSGSYAQYQNYLQTEPQRTIVNQLQQSLSYTDTPLTDIQSDQLVQILASTTPTPGAGPIGPASVAYVSKAGGGSAMIAVGAPTPDGPMFWGGGVSVSDAAIAQARNVLAPAQVQALQEIQQQQQAAAQLREQVFQRVVSPPSAGPTASPAGPPGG